MFLFLSCVDPLVGLGKVQNDGSLHRSEVEEYIFEERQQVWSFARAVVQQESASGVLLGRVVHNPEPGGAAVLVYDFKWCL